MAEAEERKESHQEEVNSQFTDAKDEPVSISESQNESQQQELSQNESQQQEVSQNESQQQEVNQSESQQQEVNQNESQPQEVDQNESQQQEVDLQFADAKEEPISTGESLQREVSLQFADAKEEPVSISEEGKIEEAEEQSSEAATRIKELESQLSGMKVEFEALISKKSELESQVESQETEARQLRDENSKLNTRVLELEEMSEKIALETEELDLEQELLSIQVQNSYLEQSMECMRNEASNQVKDLIDRVNVMQQELGHTQNTKSQEVSENPIQIGTPRRMMKEKEELEVKIKVLELGSDTLLNQKNELGQQVKSKVHETIQLKDEKEDLHARIFELEGLVTARENDLTDLESKAESGEKIEASQIKKKILDQPRISRLSKESKPDSGEKLQSGRSTISENISKFNQFSDKTKVSKGGNESTKSESGEKLQSSRSMLNINTGSKLNWNARESVDSPRKSKGDQSVQRRMDDLAAEFRRHIEDKVRLLSQRIRVLEQLNAENGSTHKLLQQENKLLLEKVTSCETQFKKLKDLHKITQTTMKGLEFMASKLEEGNKDLDRMTNMLGELQEAKNWIQQRNESIRQLGYTLDSLNAELEEKGEHIQKLEAKVEELDEEVLYIGEEKREVIRQLCVLTDHLRGENQELKDMISKFNARNKSTKTLTFYW